MYVLTEQLTSELQDVKQLTLILAYIVVEALAGLVSIEDTHEAQDMHRVEDIIVIKHLSSFVIIVQAFSVALIHSKLAFLFAFSAILVRFQLVTNG